MTETSSRRRLKEPGAPVTPAELAAWQEAKIERALKDAEDHPEKRIPLHLIWKKFGLES